MGHIEYYIYSPINGLQIPMATITFTHVYTSNRFLWLPLHLLTYTQVTDSYGYHYIYSPIHKQQIPMATIPAGSMFTTGAKVTFGKVLSEPSEVISTVVTVFMS